MRATKGIKWRKEMRELASQGGTVAASTHLPSSPSPKVQPEMGGGRSPAYPSIFP